VKQVLLNAEIREKTGKSQMTKIRNKGLVPGIICEKGKESISITIDRREFVKLLHKEGENAVINIELKKGEKSKKSTVIIKEIQFNVIKEGILHVDFQSIKLTEKISVHIPLHTQGDAEAPGVKEGGMLEHILRELEIECLPANMPKEIIIDVSNLKINESIHVKDIQLEEGITMLSDPEQIAVLVKFEAAKEVEEEKTEEEGVTPAEPEVIKKGKSEEEAAE